MIVVSDASPIRALHHLGLLALCQDLYGRIIVPEAVHRELQQATSVCPAMNIGAIDGFDVRTPHATPVGLGVPSNLDAGETQAIALALELNADLLLMDERLATDVARNLGIATIGVIGVLLEAKRHGKIDRIVPCVDRLVTELRFFVSSELRRQIAILAGEAA